MNKFFQRGHLLIEILLASAIFAIAFPALMVGLSTATDGKAQQMQRMQANTLIREAEDITRSVREKGWTAFAENGVFHPIRTGNSWALASGPETVDDFTREIEISDVYRDTSGAIVDSDSGTFDPSTKRVDTTVAWTVPLSNVIRSTTYLTRYLENLVYIHTTDTDFNTNNLIQTATTNTAGGELQLSDNNKAKWCEPSFSSATIDLPDGPPVAVAATASASVSTPNDVFVAVAPEATTSTKLAYVNVSADTDPPVSTLQGTFTLDVAKYSDPGLVPSGIDLDNNFKTNDVAYYTSDSGKRYALLATDLPTKEVIAVLINDNASGNAEFQDPVNRIYKYQTFFNTIPYNSSNTGFQNPSSQDNDSGGDGDGFGSNPSRAYTNNSSFAVDTNSGSGTSTNCLGSDKDKHRYYNYDFSVPSGATFTGIEVRLDARVDSTSGSPHMCVQLSWDGGSTWTTPQTTSTLTTSESTYILGGSNDTWGRTWGSDDFSNSNFRVRVINVASSTSRDFSLDWVAVNVSYSGGTSPYNDQAPYGYGATSITVSNDTGYAVSGGYLYAFDLSTIDSKNSTNGLEMLGCRIELDGYDCNPGSGIDRKYSAGETGTSWSSTTLPAHNDCSDGGNIELYATNDIYPVNADGSTYIFAAVGAGTNPELNIINVSSVPNENSSPAVNSNSCGRISGGNSNWKRVGSFDFNSRSGTEEAANSVYARADGNRAYISSNGTSDSKQFYIINTTNKSSPSFLSGSPATGPTSGFYQGSGENGEMYPRRSLTVLNGQRVVLVGKDGVPNSNNTQEYQVLNSSNEASPSYCAGIDFDQGFNDLTSVIEADLDTYVYMVANTNTNELKIIQGGPDGRYYDTGTAESPTFDNGFSTAFNRFTVTSTVPASGTIGWQFAITDAVNGSCAGVNFSFVGPDGTANTYYPATGGPLLLDDDGNGYENPGRCMRYKAFFSTTDVNSTPVVNDITINYSP